MRDEHDQPPPLRGKEYDEIEQELINTFGYKYQYDRSEPWQTY